MHSNRELDTPMVVEIRIRGYIDQQWSDWFNGLIIKPQQSRETLLTGTVADQAALYGILLKLHNLGLPLLSFRRVQAGSQSSPAINKEESK